MSFDIGANGILHVGAKDKTTGKESRITIKANSGLSETEIDKMVNEAESHADEDRRLRELVDSRNHGDALVHSTRKALTEYGEKLDAGKKERIDVASRGLEDALKGSDRAEIAAKAQALAAASQKLGEMVYADVQAAQGADNAAAGAAGAGASAGSAGQPEEDVVDAEFKEVKTKR